MAWSLTYLPAFCNNLSTTAWKDHDKLTNAIDTLTSVSTTAHNAWDAVVNIVAKILKFEKNMSHTVVMYRPKR